MTDDVVGRHSVAETVEEHSAAERRATLEEQSAAERRATLDDAPSGIAESLADLFEAVLVAGRPFAGERTNATPPPPAARIALDRDDRRLLLEAHERCLHGALSIPAAEPHLAGIVRALAQVILDQEPIA